MFWARDIQIEKIESGGGKGRPAEQTTTINRFFTGAFAVCSAPTDGSGMARIKRVYVDGKVVYANLIPSEGTLDADTLAQSADFLANNLEIYLGTDTQNPSPTIQANTDTGVGGDPVPSFRRMCYIVIKDLLRESTQPPKVDVEVVLDAYPGTAVSSVLKLVAELVGVSSSDIEATELDNDFLIGGSLKQDGGSIREFCENLQRVFLFSATENKEGKIVFFKQAREGLVTSVVPTADMGAGTQQETVLFEEEILQLVELPTRAEILYKNFNDNYNDSIETNQVLEVDHDNALTLRSDLVLISTQARTAVGQLINRAWTERRSFDFSLPYSYRGTNALSDRILPGNALTIPLERPELEPIDSVDVQIQQINLGSNYVLEIKAIQYLDDAATEVVYEVSLFYIPVDQPQPDLPDPAQGTNPFNPTGGGQRGDGQSAGDTSSTGGAFFSGGGGDFEVPPPPTADIVALDIPAFNIDALTTEQQDGIYFALSQTTATTWLSGLLYFNIDGGSFQAYASSLLTIPSTVGEIIADPLPVARHELIDKVNSTTPDLQPGSASLVSISDSDFENQVLNIALVGDEIICYQTAGASISMLHRGLFGTEQAIGTHTLNERFVLLRGSGSAIYRLTGIGIDTFLGKMFDFKAVSSGQAAGAVPVSDSATIQVNSQKPYAPVTIKWRRMVGGDIGIVVRRRDRKSSNNAATLSLNQPNTEVQYLFSIQILDDLDAVIRTFDSPLGDDLVEDNPTVTYDLADQVTDGFNIQSWKVRASQFGTLQSNVYEEAFV